MSDATGNDTPVPEGWADERNCYLTTTGRRTGRPHEIEIWFAVYEGHAYMVSGRGERSDWVRNLRADSKVKIRAGSDEREATARVIDDSGDHPARRVWAEKYGRGVPTSLLVEVSLL